MIFSIFGSSKTLRQAIERAKDGEVIDIDRFDARQLDSSENPETPFTISRSISLTSSRQAELRRKIVITGNCKVRIDGLKLDWVSINQAVMLF